MGLSYCLHLTWSSFILICYSFKWCTTNKTVIQPYVHIIASFLVTLCWLWLFSSLSVLHTAPLNFKKILWKYLPCLPVAYIVAGSMKVGNKWPTRNFHRFTHSDQGCPPAPLVLPSLVFMFIFSWKIPMFFFFFTDSRSPRYTTDLSIYHWR